MSWNLSDPQMLDEAIMNLKRRLAKTVGASAGMVIVDVGCGQGGFTVVLAKSVGRKGRVFAVDISDEYQADFRRFLEEHEVQDIVTFTQADASDLQDSIPSAFADMVVSYRFLEELKQPETMGKIVKEMARIVRKNGKVCITELNSHAESKAEEVYIRLHSESGDSLFESDDVVAAMKEAGLSSVRVERFETDIWLSPDLAKQNLESAQVWYDEGVERNLGSLIDMYGMKYPALLVYSGKKR